MIADRFFFKTTMFFASLILLATCSQEPASNTTIDNNQPKMTNEHLRLSISSYLQNATLASEKEQLDTATYWYAKATEVYAKSEQWDSLYTTTRDAFMLGYNAYDYTAFRPMLHKCDSLVLTAPDTIQAKIAEIQGFINDDEGNSIQSLPHYKKASTIWEKHLPSKKLAGCYNMLGILYNKLEDYPLSEQYYRKGVLLSEQLQDIRSQSDHHFNLGEVLLCQNKWETAIDNFEESHKLLSIADGGFETQMASAYLVGKQPDKALLFAQKALDLVKNYQERGAVDLFEAYGTLGDVQLTLGNTSKAMGYYKLMLENVLENHHESHREVAKAHIFLGRAYQQDQSWNLALQEYHRAIEIFLPAFQSNQLTDCPSSEELLSREGYLMEALRYKGQVLVQKYNSSKKNEFLKAADKHFETAIQFINQIRIYHTEIEAKTFYGRQYAIPYTEEAIKTKLLLYKKTRNPVYQHKAFELTQQATAFLLRESVNEQRAIQLANVSPDTISQLKNINTSISEIQITRAESVDTIAQDSLGNLLFQFKKKRQDLLEMIEKNYPEYYQLKHSLAPVNLNKIQRNLDTNTLVIKYFLGENNLYTFAFSHQRIQSFSAPIDTAFLRHFNDYRLTLGDLDYIRVQPVLAEKQFIESSQYLYEQLLQPVLSAFEDDKFTRLAIIPDGILNYLSFECMPTRPIDNWLEADAFLINQYAVRYAYYAGLLLSEKQEENKKSRFVGFGTEYDNKTLDALGLIEQDSVTNPQLNDAFRGKKLSKLLFADDEVDEVADLVSGKAFLNTAATKANFLHHTPDYEAIHIATHSFIDSDNDSTAFIVFNQDDSGDYLLSLPEIYGLDLNADLIALSSCQSSLGALERSEGVMSLARAFKFAGSKSLVASQWSISDRSSFLIMKAFYKNLAQGLSKDEALQKAKLNYLNDDQLSSPAYRIPAYWGALVMVGDAQPMFFEAAITPWYYLIGLLAIGLVGTAIYKQKR